MKKDEARPGPTVVDPFKASRETDRMPGDFLEARSLAFQEATSAGPGKMHEYGTGKPPVKKGKRKP